MKNYELTLDERQIIEDLSKRGYSAVTIAKQLGRGGTTIAREIRKNGGPLFYNAIKAQKESYQRKSEGYIKISESVKKSGYNPFESLKARIENLEMQLEILVDTIKELKNGN